MVQAIASATERKKQNHAEPALGRPQSPNFTMMGGLGFGDGGFIAGLGEFVIKNGSGQKGLSQIILLLMFPADRNQRPYSRITKE